MRILALLFFCVLHTQNAFSWGANGHRIVARICDLNLTPQAKTEIQNILGKDYIEELANWPDYVKSERGWDFAEKWHYTTVHPDQGVLDVRAHYLKDSSINDAIEAIEFMHDILLGDAAAIQSFEKMMRDNRARPLANSTKATALAFLVHLVGDIHQPLHVGKNRDLGGNKISVLFFYEKTNLHAVWDTELIEHERLSYTEFARFSNKLTPAEMIDAQQSTIDDWAQESIVLRERIYNTLYNYTDRDSGLPSFSWQYQHDFIPEVKQRLALSGVRLAGILNNIFG